MVNMTTCGSWYVGRKEKVREEKICGKGRIWKIHPTASLHVLKDGAFEREMANLY